MGEPTNSAKPVPFSIRRHEVPEGASLCDYCTGQCCRYFCLPIPTPEIQDDFDVLAAYLEHERALAYVSRRVWYLLIKTVCTYLQADYRCGIYETRPRICRQYTTDTCEYNEGWDFDQVFHLADQIREYAQVVVGTAETEARPSGSRGAADRMPRPLDAVIRHPIDTPETWGDFDDLRWFLAHSHSVLLVENSEWYLLVRPWSSDPQSPWTLDEIPRGTRVFFRPEEIWDYAHVILPARPRQTSVEASMSSPTGCIEPIPTLVQIGPGVR